MTSLEGKLEAPIHPDECVWDMDGKTVVITLLKAAETPWRRLLVDHEERRPRRIDGGETLDDGDKEDALAEARGCVQELLMAAQADDVFKFKDALEKNRDEETPDDDEADRTALEKCRDANSRNSLHFAAHAGSCGVVEYILEKLPSLLEAKDLDGCTALSLALMQQMTECAQLLLDKGADVTAASHDGTTALHHAAGTGDGEMVRTLVERGALLEASNKDTSTALHWASGEGAAAALQALVELKADPSVVDGRGISALAMAVVRGAEKCTGLLAQNGADCMGMLPGGMTPLHVAADMGSVGICTLLVEADQTPANTLDEQGNTPLSLATAGGHDEVVKLLEPHTQAEATPAAPDDSFFPAEKFDQVRPGYLFKMGDQGLGYYKDTAVVVAAVEPQIVIPEEVAAEALQFKEEGNKQLKAKDLAAAEAAYSSAIELDPTQHTYFMNRSLCRLKLKNKDGALADAESAKELAPDVLKVRFRVGASLEALGRYIDAAGEYYEGLKFDMDNKEMKKAFEHAVMMGKQDNSFKTYN